MSNETIFLKDGHLLVENRYSLSTEPNAATFLTTGNGYIGIRGSLEEYGSLRIQGCYIRGVIDEIFDQRTPYCDNLYMKKYYFNEDKLKEFETQECIINLVDFLLVRFEIDGETFYPWEGRLHEWTRTLDMENNCLIRDVVWENEKGDLSKLHFERFSSFDNDHIYCIKASVTPLNHNKPIKILTGLDLRTKTYGQRTTTPIYSEARKNTLLHELTSGKKYSFSCGVGVENNLIGADNATWEDLSNNDFLAHSISFDSKENTEYVLEKKVVIVTSRDTDKDVKDFVRETLASIKDERYDALFAKSTAAYKALFSLIDIKIDGDRDADEAVRFSNYHTLISIARNDSVHSLSAKALTGEIYNNFVWWDAEVYQFPVFLHTMPEFIKNALLYRYDKLDMAKQNAKKEGLKGSRFPFTSAVTGEETVWIYARHPFMQIHIVSDIGLAVLRYFELTGDEAFMKNNGVEMLLEICRYWVSRSVWVEENERFEILAVTGTDEHHPYVDNNAYTNYSVHKVVTETLKLIDENKLVDKGIKAAKLDKAEVEEFKSLADKLYLPFDKRTGMIPQFDNYFSLSRDLEIQGGTTATSFQMKHSGLYHESQVIKQPDVMLLFTYMDMDFSQSVYSRNWNYYEARCESSSSLSYPVHAIAAADMEQTDSAYQYLMKTARLDLDDAHACAHEGMHAACAAGAWLAIVRGIVGMKLTAQQVSFDPKLIPWWNSVSYKSIWRNVRFDVAVTHNEIKVTVCKDAEKALVVNYLSDKFEVAPGETKIFEIPLP